MLTLDEIQKILPHRYPFLLIDKVIERVPYQKIVGIKNVTVNEPFFQGHFPGKPIMPGVIIIEASGQLAGLGIEHNERPNNIEYLAGVQKFIFKKIVVPGDQLIITASHFKKVNQLLQVEVMAQVSNQLVAEGVLILTASN
jgi:3-hydroxyacyl-[acyl-carrier-protein] dehydratase